MATTDTDDLAAAIKYLRVTMDDQALRSTDRLSAATNLAKLLQNAPPDTTNERKAMQMTDEELLIVVAEARERRRFAPTLPPVIATPSDVPRGTFPVVDNVIDWASLPHPSPSLAVPKVDEHFDLAAMLADVPDAVDYAALMS